MPSKIDQSLLPPVIRESVDPEILNRAQSIEWSINRDAGEDEHGFVDGSHEDYLSSQNLMYKTHHGQAVLPEKSQKQIEWLDNNNSGRDSGFEHSPTSPALGKSTFNAQRLDSSHLDDYSTGNTPSNVGSMKRHPQGMRPFPIYKVNQGQLEGDVVYEVAPRAKPGERTVHYEKSTKVINEEELNALGLDPNLFGPNTNTTMDEQEEELIETSVLKGGRRELEDIYNSMRTEAGDYFDRRRARSMSPDRQPIEDEQTSTLKKTVIFGSVDEINNREQEFYPYRDAHQGKPLPGDNEYGTWGSRFDDKRQWKLCNGQWIRVGQPPKPKPAPEPEPKYEKYLAERVKCKPPKKQVAEVEPIRKAEPQSGSYDDLDSLDLDRSLSPVDSSPPQRSYLEPRVRNRRQPLLEDEPIDLDALRDKYRPKAPEREVLRPDDAAAGKPAAEKPAEKADTNLDYESPPGTILLKPPTPPVQEIKVEPITPTYVEMMKPLKKPDGEEEKMMEDPNLMWMRMGPAQYGPPFGTLKKRKGREEEWVGPPCELCHKQIEERRCMLAENMKFHCWHFACSFCLKTLKPADFLIAEADKKPYCLNCHKREFPEISLANLHLDE